MAETEPTRAARTARRTVRSTITALGELLWPPVCDNCGRPVATAHDRLCRDCWDQLLTCIGGTYCPRCGRDASLYGLLGGVCPACQGHDYHFDGIARVGVYSDTLQRMILAFKNGRSELASSLSVFARSAFEGGRFHDHIDLLVPVPLHWTRRLARGYNQSRLIAARLKHPTARVNTDLVRIRRTKPQPAAVTPAARARNVKGAFAVHRDHRLAGQTICLVDDIKTTGATLNECAVILKAAGAVAVYGLVLAVAGQDLR